MVQSSRRSGSLTFAMKAGTEAVVGRVLGSATASSASMGYCASAFGSMPVPSVNDDPTAPTRAALRASPSA